MGRERSEMKGEKGKKERGRERREEAPKLQVWQRP